MTRNHALTEQVS